MNFIKRLLREWFTGPGSKEYELARVLFAVVVLAGLAYQGVAVWKNQAFSMIEFGTGMGSLLTLGGLGTKFKDEGAAKAVQTEREVA